MRTAVIIAFLLVFGLPVEAQAQLFGRDRERITLRYRRAAPRFGCVGPGCYQPIRPLFVQPTFAPSWGGFPRSRDRDLDFAFSTDGFGGRSLRLRTASRGGWGGGWAGGFSDCPWCR